MSRKIDLAYILAYDAEFPVRKLLSEKYGKTAKNYDDLENKINDVIRLGNDDDLKALAMLHPDRQLILSTYIPAPAPATVEVKKEKTSNACGACSGFDAEEKSNCAGNKNCNCNKGMNYSFGGPVSDAQKDDMLKIVAVLGLVAIVGIILKQ